MKITSGYNLNPYINRYNDIAKLFSQTKGVKNQRSEFSGAMSLMSKNLSYLLDQNMKVNFEALAEKADQLQTSEPGNAFDQSKASAVSSNPNRADVTVQNGAGQGVYNLEINRLATAQENTGDWLSANSKNGGAGSQREFTLELKNERGFVTKSADFTVDSTINETNKETLVKVADKINRQELGVSARVEMKTVNGSEQVRLVVEGDQTGAGRNFSFNDQAGTLTKDLKINNVTTTAQNAQYRVNGFAYESQTNRISLDRRGKVTASLKSVTTGENVKIEVKPEDVDSLYRNVRDFIDQYNQTVKNEGPGLYTGLTTVTTGARNKLASIGINLNPDKTLSINETGFRSSAVYNSDKVREILADKNGFAAKIEAKAEELRKADLNDPRSLKGYLPGSIFSFLI